MRTCRCRYLHLAYHMHIAYCICTVVWWGSITDVDVQPQFCLSKGHSVRLIRPTKKRGLQVRSEIIHQKGVFRWWNLNKNVFCHKFGWKLWKFHIFLTNLLFFLSKNKDYCVILASFWFNWTTCRCLCDSKIPNVASSPQNTKCGILTTMVVKLK